MKSISFHAVLFVTALLCGCSREQNTASNVRVPGSPQTAKSRVLEAGAAALQDKPPIDAINAYLDGFHFYNGRLKVQMEAHHYCSFLNEDVTQCVIYDGNVKDAKLMGVEYIISASLFSSLALDEKELWHSHSYEVKSGGLIAPGIPEVAEKALMKKLVTTYGKTWHTWHTDMNKQLPLGMPQLMMGFTADGQVDAAMVAARDQRFGIRSADKRAQRMGIPVPHRDPGSDAWQHGRVLQIADPTGTQHVHEAAAQGKSASGINTRSNKP